MCHWFTEDQSFLKQCTENIKKNYCLSHYIPNSDIVKIRFKIGTVSKCFYVLFCFCLFVVGFFATFQVAFTYRPKTKVLRMGKRNKPNAAAEKLLVCLLPQEVRAPERRRRETARERTPNKERMMGNAKKNNSSRELHDQK